MKSVVVTGSTSGIGLAIASAFAETGANVVINGFGAADEIEAIRAKLDGLGAGRGGQAAAAGHADKGGDLLEVAHFVLKVKNHLILLWLLFSLCIE